MKVKKRKRMKRTKTTILIAMTGPPRWYRCMIDRVQTTMPNGLAQFYRYTNYILRRIGCHPNRQNPQKTEKPVQSLSEDRGAAKFAQDQAGRQGYVGGKRNEAGDSDEF
jgi:hypothetical protein